MSSRRNNLLILSAKLFGMMVFSLLAFTVLGHPKVEARIGLNPNPSGADIPADQREILQTCDERRPLQSPGFVRWVSMRGNPIQRATKVPYGTASIDLDYHFASTVCSSSSAVLQTTAVFTGATAGVQGIVNQGTGLNHTGFFGPGNFDVVGTYRHADRGFSYAPAGGFIASGWHTIGLDQKAINQFEDGRFLCVGDSAPVANSLDFGRCPVRTPTFTFYVEVGDIEIKSDVSEPQASCDAINGWAFDEDRLGTSIRIRVGVNYWLGDPRGTERNTIANIPRSDVNAAYPQTGNTPHGFSIDVSDITSRGGTHTFYVYAENYNTAGAFAGDDLIKELVVNGDDCGRGFSLNPKGTVTLEDDEENPTRADFSDMGVQPSSRDIPGVTVSRRYVLKKVGQPAVNLGAVPPSATGLTIGGSGYTFAANPAADTRPVSGLVPGDQVCLVIGINPARGRINNAGAIVPGTAEATEREVSCDVVVNRPYVSFYGSDVKVGGDFAGASTCWTEPKSKITSWANGNGGSSVQFAAFALNTIDGLNSASLRTDALRPDGLKSVGTAFHTCMDDYYAVAPPVSAGVAMPAAGSSGKFNIPAGTVLQNMTIARGQHLYLYVDGDVTINGNIMFDTNWGNKPDDIPSFYLVAKGNINITNLVERLDGVFVAQPSAALGSGAINTCSGATAATMFNDCYNQLVVNGAFVAKRVKFTRTFGSLRNTVNDSPYVVGSKICDGRIPSSRTVCAAEVFNFNPGIYIGPAPTNSTGGSTDEDSSDAVNNLPPVL